MSDEPPKSYTIVDERDGNHIARQLTLHRETDGSWFMEAMEHWGAKTDTYAYHLCVLRLDLAEWTALRAAVEAVIKDQTR
jgi:hypothetical protein